MNASDNEDCDKDALSEIEEEPCVIPDDDEFGPHDEQKSIQKESNIETNSFQMDVLNIVLGILSSGMCGWTISAFSLSFAMNTLFVRHNTDILLLNDYIAFTMACFYIMFCYGMCSHRSIPACALAYDLFQSGLNTSLNAQRAALISISVNLCFSYSNFGMYLLLAAAFFRCKSCYF